MKTDSYKTFTYPCEYDEVKCDKFISHFINLGMHISISILKNSGRYFGLDLAKTAAYEGCFKAYLLSEKINNIEYKHQKGLVRMCVKRSFWSFAVIFGFIASSGQSYFPTGYVDYNEFFSQKAKKNNHEDEIDIKLLNDLAELLPEKEREIYHLYLSGYDFAEIGRKLGYKNKSSSLKMHQRTIKRLKEKVLNGQTS